MGDDMDDPEDLTMGSGVGGGGGGGGVGMLGHNNNNMSGGGGGGSGGRGYHDSLMSFSHPNTTITRVRHGAVTPKSMMDGGGGGGGKDSTHGTGGGMPPSAATGSSILDTYLQFITENTFGKCFFFIIFSKTNVILKIKV